MYIETTASAHQYENKNKPKLKYSSGSGNPDETSSGYSSRESLLYPMQPISINSQKESVLLTKFNKSNNSIPTEEFVSDNKSDKENFNSQPSLTWGISPSRCCQHHESISEINDQLLLQNRLLEEHNANLREELQLARRFYQCTLSELSSQLTRAENHIKYLSEAIDANAEAVAGTQSKDYFGPSVKLQSSFDRDSFDCSSSSVITSTPRSAVDIIASRSKILHGRSFIKMKEQLLERNQLLKTDIQKLKVRTDLTRSSSVPALNNKVLPDVKQKSETRNNSVKNNRLLMDGSLSHEKKAEVDRLQLRTTPK